jgi:RNA recognition motif-containing protein
MGNSKGTADIEYATHEEAEKAIKEMNSKCLYVIINAL